MEVLKLKTPLYLMWGQATLIGPDGDPVCEYYPDSCTFDQLYISDRGEFTPLMENINRFFLDNVDRMYPKSLGQRFWLAHIEFNDPGLYANKVKTGTVLNVGVVCPDMLKPYGIIGDWDIYCKEIYVKGRRFDCINHPFFIPGHSNFAGLYNSVFSLIPDLEKMDGENLPEGYFWYYMKKKALGL